VTANSHFRSWRHFRFNSILLSPPSSFMNVPDPFAQLESSLHQCGPAGLLDQLCTQLDTEARYHELFEAMKIRIRHRLQLPLWSTAPDELAAGSVRDQLEAGLLEACQYVGNRLLQAGRIRDAWSYLRPVGDLASLRTQLAQIQPTDENAGELIELYLQEGLDLEKGFQLLLKHYGTCNTITTYETSMYGRPRDQRAVGARLLLRQLHQELRVRLLEHLERLTGQPADPQPSICEMLERHPQLMADGAYHTDTTHLASITRIARNTLDHDSWQLARELCAYGQRLDVSLQYHDGPPFEDLYPTSDRFFAALLDDQRDAQLAFFRERADATDPYHETTHVREVYVDLLARCGRAKEAWEEAIRLLPPGMQTTGLAPSLLELAQQSGQQRQLCELARAREDRLTFTLGLLGH
jgi:hypothetical protein